ncbi:kinase-like domain-containing protein [Trametes maxima]|nr:kinase-like domain-containing protein [Trametes maxima]
MHFRKVKMFMEQALDGIFNYELHEELTRTTTATVYRATCKKGRLRNRQVAIKKIRGTSVVSFQSTLCHPSVISLLSAFSTPSGYCQVYELCSEGTLSDIVRARDADRLIEAELRGVARSLVDALIYLRKELVLHRDINPANILVADDGRVKLSGFGSAVKLSTAESTMVEFCGSANYVAPEILRARPYSFGVDLWSLGCVLLTCILGSPAFDAPSPDQVYSNICSATYALPNTTSQEVQNLVQSILKENPHDRIQLHRLHGHPFFSPSFSVSPLNLSTTRFRSYNPPQHDLSYKASGSPNRYPTHLSKDPARPRPAAVSLQTKPKQGGRTKRIPFEDITNVYTNTHQAVESDSALLRRPPTRVVSALASAHTSGMSGTTRLVGPQQPTSALAADSGTLKLSSGRTLELCGPSSHVNSPLVPSSSGENNHSDRCSPRSQLRRVLADSHGLLDSRRVASLGSTRPTSYSLPRTTKILQPRTSSQATSITAVTHPTTRA